MIELLTATVISLLVMGATVQLFGTVGNEISGGRSNIELGDRIRSAVERLRKDLRGVTVDMRPWTRAEDATGYFEIYKGPQSSWDVNQTSATGAPLIGYTQDMLLFTTRSRDMPFVGRALNSSGQPTTVESQVAEVAWFLRPTVNAQGSPVMQLPGAAPVSTYTLYRRSLLVLPGYPPAVSSAASNQLPPSIPQSSYYYIMNTNSLNYLIPQFDISAHPDSTGQNMVLNSLADLTYRENRIFHFSTTALPVAAQNFPALIVQPTPFPYNSGTPSDPKQRYGEDVVLTNVLSFDVKVWDPWAQVRQDKNGNPLVPSDIGYSSTSSPSTAIGSGVYGAYVDLGWGESFTKTLDTNPNAPAAYFVSNSYGLGSKSLLAATSKPAQASNTYDTWPAGYEFWFPGTSSTGAQSSNVSSNGFDNDGSNGVNDPNERLTAPPYPVPLRGVQIKIRTYEFTSRQVREVTLQENFVPD